MKVIATKRRWGDNGGFWHAMNFRCSNYYGYCESSSIGYDEEDIGDLVDEKGFHDDREEFAAKADIVVPCLRLDSKTVTSSVFFCSIVCSFL